MGNFFALGVRQWAAVLVGADDEQCYGDAAGEEIIPAGYRRRMGRLERLAVRCMLGVLASGSTSSLIFCSRFGNIDTLSALLRSIAAGEPMSPMAFSGSVHNAAPGLVGQIRKEKIAHTALAGGGRTLEAGLVEAYASLICEGFSDVVVCYTDLPLSGVYSGLDQDAVWGLGLALRLSLAGQGGGAQLMPGISGGRGLVEDLILGKDRLHFGGDMWGISAC
jgi:hypothetical protein